MTKRPLCLTRRRQLLEESQSDALSDVLSAVRLTGAAFFDVTARAPWFAEQPTREMVLPKILPGAEHLISYHVVTEGECYAARLGDKEPVQLTRARSSSSPRAIRTSCRARPACAPSR